MTRFTRIDSKQGGATRPQAGGTASSRLYGDAVNMGEPLTLQGDAELRKQVETSLEAVAKERLLEAEKQAEAKIAEGMAAAERVLADAEAQAAQMLEATQAQVNQIREEAHESGFKAGFQEGYGDASEQVETETIQLLQGAQLLAEGAYASEKRILQAFKKHAVALIGHIVQRILHRELTDSPETLLALVEKAVDSLYLTGKVRIVVSAQVIQELRGFSKKNARHAGERYESF